MQHEIDDDKLSEFLHKAYLEHAVPFTLENIKTMLACCPDMQAYLADIGITTSENGVHIQTPNKDVVWAKRKLEMVIEHHG